MGSSQIGLIQGRLQKISAVIFCNIQLVSKV